MELGCIAFLEATDAIVAERALEHVSVMAMVTSKDIMASTAF